MRRDLEIGREETIEEQNNDGLRGRPGDRSWAISSEWTGAWYSERIGVS